MNQEELSPSFVHSNRLRKSQNIAEDKNRRYYSNIPVRNQFSILGEEPGIFVHFKFEQPSTNPSMTTFAPEIDLSMSIGLHGSSQPRPLQRSGSSEFIESSLTPFELMDGSATRPFVASHALERRRRRKRDLAAKMMRPYIEKGLMSGMIYMLGEAIACGLFSRNGAVGFYSDAFFRYSVLHSTLIGMFANGPMLHLFFELVDRFVRFKSTFLNIFSKVVVDQIVWGCLWNFMYILLMNLATDSPGFGYVGEGLGMDFVFDLCKGFNSAFWKAIDWRLHAVLLKEGLKMLPMDIICYWLVPLPLRAIWVATVDVAWVTILSQYD